MAEEKRKGPDIRIYRDPGQGQSIDFKDRTQEVGALWERTSTKSGKIYWTGTINSERVLAYPTQQKAAAPAGAEQQGGGDDDCPF